MKTRNGGQITHGQTTMNGNGYKVVPMPRMRYAILDTLRVAQRKPVVHALVEVDVTDARAYLKAHKQRTGESLSFTAFIIACLAKAVAEQKMVHAYRQGRRHLVVFDDVDVCIVVEHEMEGYKVATPYVIRSAQRKSFRAIHEEIRTTQRSAPSASWALPLRLGQHVYPYLPQWLRVAYWRAFDRYPHLRKRIGGTVVITSVGMFGNGKAWGIPITDYSLGVFLGGIGEAPGVVDGRIEVRQYLCMTVSTDHDVVDGAPLARFIRRLKELIEAGYGLEITGVEDARTAQASAAHATAAQE